LSGPHRHRLLEVDARRLRGTCAVCGSVDLYRRPGGRGFICGPAQRARSNDYRERNREQVRESNRLYLRPHLAHREACCERCGYDGLFDSALAVHHRDGDHANNDPANLQTLCVRCHAEVHALLRIQEDAPSDVDIDLAARMVAAGASDRLEPASPEAIAIWRSA
jgi:5-methylcytosine-specific restriction endonuclease McrA